MVVFALLGRKTPETLRLAVSCNTSSIQRVPEDGEVLATPAVRHRNKLCV